MARAYAAGRWSARPALVTQRIAGLPAHVRGTRTPSLSCCCTARAAGSRAAPDGVIAPAILGARGPWSRERPAADAGRGRRGSGWAETSAVLVLRLERRGPSTGCCRKGPDRGRLLHTLSELPLSRRCCGWFKLYQFARDGARMSRVVDQVQAPPEPWWRMNLGAGACRAGSAGEPAAPHGLGVVRSLPPTSNPPTTPHPPTPMRPARARWPWPAFMVWGLSSPPAGVDFTRGVLLVKEKGNPVHYAGMRVHQS